jgi:hypothetical protein
MIIKQQLPLVSCFVWNCKFASFSNHFITVSCRIVCYHIVFYGPQVVSSYHAVFYRIESHRIVLCCVVCPLNRFIISYCCVMLSSQCFITSYCIEPCRFVVSYCIESCCLVWSSSPQVVSSYPIVSS